MNERNFSIRQIGEYAFNNCPKLTEVKLPKSLVKIGAYAFFDTTDVERTFYVNNNLTSIENYAFYYIKGSIEYAGSSDEWNAIKKADSWNSNGSLSVSYSSVISDDISSEIFNPSAQAVKNKMQIYDIANALINLIDLSKTNFASRVVIETSSDNICIPVLSDEKTSGIIDWGDGTKDFYSAYKSISHKYKTKESHIITIYCNITKIKSGSLRYGIDFEHKLSLHGNISTTETYSMSTLTTEFFSDSVTSMNGTFGAVSYKLNKFKLKSNISSLPRSCFENCSSLTDVDISECGSLTTLNNYCFSGCTGLKSIIIPKSVNLIMPYCFRYCSSLTEIEIPDGVQELSTYSFYECSNLNTIT